MFSALRLTFIIPFRFAYIKLYTLIMYIPWILIILSAVIFYFLGYKKGNLNGKEEMMDRLLNNPELYAQLKDAEERAKEPVDEDD